jgi:hypothetical protein
MGNRSRSRVTLPPTVWVLALGAASCTEPEVKRTADPFERAAYHCKYVLERALAREDELTPAGVLQQKIAEFGPPRVELAGEEVQFTWLPGSIKRKDSDDGHGGKCVVLVLRQYVVEATLDGRSLHAGFSF